ncbi:glycosyltransferase family 1 protein [Cryobacterium sp. 5B3]|uniref:glycosyltransferase family 4 protein n=1 Tax=Cryobacterium sp. 5B3 TaxID=3048586 RepID=UPI002AB3CD28|nr:glycosyltransferase family 1 protein [Cryobacterium sp. 5B3]MDY7540917.1 glycosyltransferase family 1 protein [Cryobacterium sp. 5B3]MEB0276140.1 glycosyltransferase family 1 protein [Cryobacterium sp. 5B3]
MTTIANRDSYDAHISQNFTSIVGSSLKCTFVHDAIFIDHPEWFSRTERAYLSVIRPSLRCSDVVFTSSDNEAQRIRRVWPETRQKVIPIGLGAPIWTQAPKSQLVDEVASRDRPYFLAVGRLNERKNLGRLIQAYSRHPRIGLTHDLVIVGARNGLLTSTAMTSHASVKVLSNVDDSQLTWLYENAAAMIFPSLEEGFGLPLLEADRFGLPIAASDIPVFREIDLADIYFDPLSVAAIGRALEDITAFPHRGAPRSPANWAEVVSVARATIVSAIGSSKE